METKRAKVFIVDDHPIVVEFLRSLINQQPDLQVCGYALTARQTLQFLPNCAPDLVSLDLSLSDRHGLDFIKDIRVVHPDLRVLVFSVHDEVIFAERVLEAGARGYIMKSATSDTWLEAVRQVAAGYSWLSPAMMARIKQQRMGHQPPSGVRGMDQLSDRELEVLQLLGQGRSVGQISTTLSLGRHTVETYQSRIKDKLGLRDAHELTLCAVSWCLTQVSVTDKDPFV